MARNLCEELLADCVIERAKLFGEASWLGSSRDCKSHCASDMD